jgi:hypothetical protein
MSQSCEAKRIQQNTASAALETAKKDYLSCLGPQAQGAAALTDAQGPLAKAAAEADQLQYMNQFLLAQMARETGNDQTITALTEMAGNEIAATRSQIDDLKTQIRTQTRRFLDSDPTAPMAIGGLYYTQVPDNRVLIGFLAAFGAFLLFVSLLIIMDKIPFAPFNVMFPGERIKIVAIGWVAAIVLMYVGFIALT